VQVPRLAILILAVALATSRLGLLVHELVGHGVAALAFGGELTGWRLHWFGGGWVGFDRDPPWRGVDAHVVQLAGILSELVVAAACAAVRARIPRPVPALAIGAAAWALAIHAGWYLAAGTYHGFGDGWLLHRTLGDARVAVVAPAATVIVVAGYLAGRRIATALRALAPAATPRRQLGAVAAALAIGLGAHAALTVAELGLRPDPAYQATMRTAGERAVGRELATEVARAETAGRPLAPSEVAAVRRALERRHRQLPVGAALIGAIAVAAAVGAARSTPARAPVAASPGAIALTAAVAAVATCLVVVIDACG
jgi:hypothetical protein